MAVPGLEFLIQRPQGAAATTRADVAVFAGLVARQAAPLPNHVRASLVAGGWGPGGTFGVSKVRLRSLLSVPVPVESWAEFDALFDWRSRETEPGTGDRLPCALGIAVRRFFGDGGAKAWIIRCGDPLPLTDLDMSRENFAEWQLSALAGPLAENVDAVPILPGLADRSTPADPLDTASWIGASAIFAIEDAAMLLLPDLPDLAAGPARAGAPPPQPPGPPEQFRPCAPAIVEAVPPPRGARPEYRAVRLDQAGYRLWSAGLKHALELLGRPRGPAHRRDVMLVAALPIPLIEAGGDDGADLWPLATLTVSGHAGSDASPQSLFDASVIGNARLQLGYPWLQTPDAMLCPEGLQSPEGSLAALIARSALEGGAFRSAAGRRLAMPAVPFPVLAGSDVARGLPGHADWLGDRICLLGVRRGGVTLLSDATAAADPAWRKGGVSRLIATLLRVARHIGDELMFEPAGPELWSRVAGRVTAVLEQFRMLGAFTGLSAADCYQVICDRRSMTNADIDAGRVRCDVIVYPASPIERIIVTLSLVEPVPATAAPAEREAA